MKRVNIAAEPGNNERELRVILSDTTGTGLTRLSFAPYLGDVGRDIANGRVPFLFQLPVNIIRSAGLEVLDGRIQRAEEGVIRGVLRMRDRGAIREVVIRPSELAILLACLGEIPLYIDEEELT